MENSSAYTCILDLVFHTHECRFYPTKFNALCVFWKKIFSVLITERAFNCYHWKYVFLDYFEKLKIINTILFITNLII